MRQYPEFIVLTHVPLTQLSVVHEIPSVHAICTLVQEVLLVPGTQAEHWLVTKPSV